MLDRAGRIRGKMRAVVRARVHAFTSQVDLGALHTYILLSDGTATSLPQFFRRPALWWRFARKLRYGLPAVIRLGSANASVRVKNNMTIVFPSGLRDAMRVVAKIGLPSEFRSGTLSREIRARRMASAGSEVKLHPCLIRYDKGLSWFVEEYIEPDRAVPRGVKAAMFLSQAVQFYARTCRARRLGASMRQYGVTFKALQELFDSAGSALDDSCEGRTWPIALIHGDLSPGNMIAAADGRVVLIDWERFGRGAIAWDLRELAPYCRETVEQVLRAVGGRDDLEPRLQLRVVAAIELWRLRARRAEALRYYTALGMSRNRGLTQIESRESALVAAVRGQLDRQSG